LVGSDGCNGFGGRFAVGPEGSLVAINGDAGGGVACDTSPAPYWVSEARRVALDDGQLVLFDGVGKSLGRLRRSG
jgi:hypothetical protein